MPIQLQRIVNRPYIQPVIIVDSDDKCNMECPYMKCNTYKEGDYLLLKCKCSFFCKGLDVVVATQTTYRHEECKEHFSKEKTEATEIGDK